VETRRLAQDAAIYAEDDSPLAFAQAVDLLLGDKERRDRMGARGAEIILETGGWRTSVERLTTLYEELLSVCRSRADSGFETLPSQRSRCFGERAVDVLLLELVGPELVESEVVVVGAHAVFPNVQPLPVEPLS